MRPGVVEALAGPEMLDQGPARQLDIGMPVTDDDWSALVAACLGTGGATVGEGAFADGPALWVGKREIAHIDRNGGLDVRLTKVEIRVRRDEFRTDSRMSLRSGASDWIEMRVADEGDLKFAIGLVKAAIAANQLTASPGPPPAGRELQRRRKFH